jgi:hypothetical protein
MTSSSATPELETRGKAMTEGQESVRLLGKNIDAAWTCLETKGFHEEQYKC